MQHISNSNHPLSILLIEDDEIDVEAITRGFQKMKMNCSIELARDGLEALELLRNNRIRSPYLILLDLNMPRMNGIEFLESLRNHPKYQDTIVFVLTTSNDERDRRAAYQKNIAGYIPKSEAGRDYINVINLIKLYQQHVTFPPEQLP